MNFKTVEYALDASIYTNLRAKVGFREYAYDDAKIAIENSLFTVVVFDDSQPIGIARLVGDDRTTFFLKDVVVDPRYQKLRIGNLLIESIDRYISTKACQGAYIGLMSTTSCVAFYEKHGFRQRPTDDMGPGMIKFFDKDEVNV